MNIPRHADPRHADVRVEWSMARAEVAKRAVTIAHAEQLAAIDATLREAREFPEVFLDASPVDRSVRSPSWRDPSRLAGDPSRLAGDPSRLAGDPSSLARDPSRLTGDPEAAEFSERAAIADLALRLGLSENTVRAQAHEAHVLQQRAPRAWVMFREGDISVPNARTVAELVANLEPGAWPVFDAAVVELAALAPARFRSRARAAAERAQPQPMAERHRRRAEERRVSVDPDCDGMAWFSAYLPAAAAQRAMAHVDAIARSLVGHPDETRTLAQIQADAAADLLAGTLASRGGARVSVAVTVPVMTLLGRSEEPGILEGHGPIDADTARELAAHAPSFARILTDPVKGTMLDVDRTTYRVPADLKRWLGVRDGGCTFPGCGRSTRNCDIDHTVDWAQGGTTSADNLSHLCRHHHRIKHNTRWRVEHSDDGLRWTSPTGLVRTADPPPF